MAGIGDFFGMLLDKGDKVIDAVIQREFPKTQQPSPTLKQGGQASGQPPQYEHLTGQREPNPYQEDMTFLTAPRGLNLQPYVPLLIGGGFLFLLLKKL